MSHANITAARRGLGSVRWYVLNQIPALSQTHIPRKNVVVIVKLTSFAAIQGPHNIRTG